LSHLLATRRRPVTQAHTEHVNALSRFGGENPLQCTNVQHTGSVQSRIAAGGRQNCSVCVYVSSMCSVSSLWTRQRDFINSTGMAPSIRGGIRFHQCVLRFLCSVSCDDVCTPSWWIRGRLGRQMVHTAHSCHGNTMDMAAHGSFIVNQLKSKSRV
jgi:hypothetical protein